MKKLIALITALCLLLTCSAAVAATTATCKQRLATRTGPGTEYDEPGSFLSQGSQVTVHTKAWDDRNNVWWVQVEFTYGGEKYRAYTGAKRLNVDLNSVPTEMVYDTDWMACTTWCYAGPGYDYHYYSNWPVYSGDFVTVKEVENGWALIVAEDNYTGHCTSGWVPLDCLTYGYMHYGEDTFSGGGYSSPSYSSPSYSSPSYSSPSYSSSSCHHVGEWMMVIASSAHVRASADTSSSTVAYVHEYEWYEILDCTVGSTGKHWWKIYVGDPYYETGWISSGVCTQNP